MERVFLSLPLQGRGPGGVGSRGSIRLNNALEASRSVRQPSITAEILSGDLRRLGVRGGDTLMIHVSLSAIGRIDGALTLCSMRWRRLSAMTARS